jgi:hypothetical protein
MPPTQAGHQWGASVGVLIAIQGQSFRSRPIRTLLGAQKLRVVHCREEMTRGSFRIPLGGVLFRLIVVSNMRFDDLESVSVLYPKLGVFRRLVTA